MSLDTQRICAYTLHEVILSDEVPRASCKGLKNTKTNIPSIASFSRRRSATSQFPAVVPRALTLSHVLTTEILVSKVFQIRLITCTQFNVGKTSLAISICTPDELYGIWGISDGGIKNKNL